MIIGIDGSRAAKKIKTGTEYYSVQIINLFGRLDKKNKFIIYTPRDIQNDLDSLPKNFTQKIMPFPKLWSQLRLSAETLQNPPDVLFVPSHTVPLYHIKNTVVTVHDLGFEHFPELYTPAELAYHRFTMRFSVKHAKRVIAISRATKADIVSLYKTNPSKITVIHHGIDLKKYSPLKNKKRNKFYKKYGSYLCSVGRLEKKKNTLGIVRAYAILRQDPKIDHKLVLVGRPGNGYDEIKNEIASQRENIQKDIIQTGYMPQDEMAEIVRAANIFVFPSFFEGFGLPILEAMASGVPVITSNISSMPEVAGSAGIIIDPHNTKQIAQKIKKIILDKNYYQSVRQKGLIHAREFSWTKCGEKTLEVLYASTQK